MTPRVSVVVRSYNRIPALCELLTALLAQDHPSFEIVVVEQSTKVAARDAARLDVLVRDPRVRLLSHPPLGGARARNVGAFAARGELLLFIDDDDLPEGPHWISAHAAAYEDPRCLGITGRHKNSPGERNTSAIPWLAYRRCQMFSPLLKMPWTYVRHDRRKAPVDSVHGTNGSIRRSALERFGGWDEDTRIEDEASFGFRAARSKRKDEYFAFDPRPVVLRGRNVKGGLDKRYMTAGEYFERLLDFVHRIIGRYHPARVIGLYPLYVVTVYGWTVAWMWGDSQAHDTIAKRVMGTLSLIPGVPGHVMRCLKRLSTSAPKGSGTDSPSRKSDQARQSGST
ncbi:MAG: glycosyltransferase family 2 protein [Deltaproteobacteria bacterium]|nr:glycosyltransferase family 2 protein [Deltaproteobacteria bacterium]